MQVQHVIKMKHGEQIVRIVRHCWIVYVVRVALATLLIVAPFFFMLPLFSLGTVGMVIFGAIVGIGVFYAIRLAILWYWNAFVITTLRVIDLDRRGFFDRIISEAPYDKIQNVSYRVKGVWGTLWNYGTIVIQSLGMTMNLELQSIANPKDVHHVITSMIDYHRKRHGSTVSQDEAASDEEDISSEEQDV